MPGARQGHIPRIHSSRAQTSPQRRGGGDTGQALPRRWGRDSTQEQSHDVSGASCALLSGLTRNLGRELTGSLAGMRWGTDDSGGQAWRQEAHHPCLQGASGRNRDRRRMTVVVPKTHMVGWDG